MVGAALAKSDYRQLSVEVEAEGTSIDSVVDEDVLGCCRGEAEAWLA